MSSRVTLCQTTTPAMISALLAGALIRAAKSTGWERFRALARAKEYRAELAKMGVTE